MTHEDGALRKPAWILGEDIGRSPYAESGATARRSSRVSLAESPLVRIIHPEPGRWYGRGGGPRRLGRRRHPRQQRPRPPVLPEAGGREVRGPDTGRGTLDPRRQGHLSGEVAVWVGPDQRSADPQARFHSR